MALKRTALAGLTMFATFFALLLGPVGAASAAPGTCAPGYPPAQCTIEVSANNVRAGGRLWFAATGFYANEEVDATIDRTPVGEFQANSKGNVGGSVIVPKWKNAGKHMFHLTGVDSGFVQKVRITINKGHHKGHGKGHGNGNNKGKGHVTQSGLPGNGGGPGGQAGAHNAGLSGNAGGAAVENAAAPNAAPNAATNNAANTAAAQSNASELAFTGAEVAGFAGAGVLLIGGGALLLVLARRRRSAQV